MFEFGRAAEKEKEKEKDFFALTSVWRRLKVPSGGINPIIAPPRTNCAERRGF